jgi:hypothetical protein
MSVVHGAGSSDNFYCRLSTDTDLGSVVPTISAADYLVLAFSLDSFCACFRFVPRLVLTCS